MVLEKERCPQGRGQLVQTREKVRGNGTFENPEGVWGAGGGLQAEAGKGGRDGASALAHGDEDAGTSRAESDYISALSLKVTLAAEYK